MHSHALTRTHTHSHILSLSSHSHTLTFIQTYTNSHMHTYCLSLKHTNKLTFTSTHYLSKTHLYSITFLSIFISVFSPVSQNQFFIIDILACQSNRFIDIKICHRKLISDKLFTLGFIHTRHNIAIKR